MWSPLSSFLLHQLANSQSSLFCPPLVRLTTLVSPREYWLEDSLLPAALYTCGGLRASCRRLPLVGQSLLQEPTVGSKISNRPPLLAAVIRIDAVLEPQSQTIGLTRCGR